MDGLTPRLSFGLAAGTSGALLAAYLKTGQPAYLLGSAGAGAAGLALYSYARFRTPGAYQGRCIGDGTLPKPTLSDYVIDYISLQHIDASVVHWETSRESDFPKPEAFRSLADVSDLVSLPYSREWLQPLEDAVCQVDALRMIWKEQKELHRKFRDEVAGPLRHYADGTMSAPVDKSPEQIREHFVLRCRNILESLVGLGLRAVEYAGDPTHLGQSAYFCFSGPDDREWVSHVQTLHDRMEQSCVEVIRRAQGASGGPSIEGHYQLAMSMCVLSRQLHALTITRLWPALLLSRIKQVLQRLTRFRDLMPADRPGRPYRVNVEQRLSKIDRLLHTAALPRLAIQAVALDA